MKFRCIVCGFIYNGNIHDEADGYVCPFCTMSKESFKELQDIGDGNDGYRQISNIQVLTEEIIPPTLPEDEVITNMDEYGNVYPETDLEESGIVEEDHEYIFFLGLSQSGIVNFRTKESSRLITEYTEAGTGRAGYTNGFYAADGAYIEHSYDGSVVKFMQAGVVGWVSADEVQVVDYRNSNVQTISHYMVSEGNILHAITTNLTSEFYANRINIGPVSAAPYLQENRRYFSYDGHYFYDEMSNNGNGFLMMVTDYRNNTRDNAVNANYPYYNYFQYLSHRSTSMYSAEILNAFLDENTQATSKMRDTAEDFVEDQNTYGANALLMIGVAANESAWGMSNIAQTLNNLFGHGAFDIDPEGNAIPYPSVSYSIRQHAYVFLSSRYLNPVSDFRYYGAHLGDKASGINVRYAADPYWGEKGANVAWRIDRENGEYDRFNYAIGIKDPMPTQHTYVIVRRDANQTAVPLYAASPSTGAGLSLGYSPSNYPFIVLGQTTSLNGFYHIQSDGVLNNNRNWVDPTGIYDFDRDFAFIPTTNTIITNVGTTETTEISIAYSTHVQGIGWLPYVENGQVSGTIGQSRRIEAIKIRIENNAYIGGVRYQSYIESIGWQNWVYDNQVSGTIGQSRRIEAMRIELTDDLENSYDVYYRVYVEQLGWLGWAQNGENAGTSGYSYRIEAIEIQLISKEEMGPISTIMPFTRNTVRYRTHVQGIGWQAYVREGQISGTIGQSRRIEAIQIQLMDSIYPGNIRYETYLEGTRWQEWVSDNQISGTIGQSRRMEAIRIELTGEMEQQYDIYYRVHTETLGWLNWAFNGAPAGSSGFSYRIEAIEILLRPKGTPAPRGAGDAFTSR